MYDFGALRRNQQLGQLETVKMETGNGNGKQKRPKLDGNES